MKIRKRLKEYRELVAKKNELQFKLQEIEGTELKGVSYDSIGTSYGTSNTTQDFVMRKEKYLDAIRKMNEEINRINNAMTVLNLKEKELIQLKYIDNHSWEHVAFTIDRSIASCKRIEISSLQKMERILSFKI